MKNMKISMKLITSFLFVILMACVVGAIGIIGMSRINSADDALYNDNYLPTVMAGDISQTVVEQRVIIRNFIIFDVINDAQDFRNAEASLETSKESMTKLMADYEKTINDDISPEDRANFELFKKIYETEWIPAVTSIHDLGAANKVEEAKAALLSAGDITIRMDDLTTAFQDINMSLGLNAVNSNTTLFRTMTIIEVVVLALAVVVALILVFYISGLISKPATFMKDILMRIGQKGDLDFSDADFRQAEIHAAVKDEIGESVNMLLTTIRRLAKVGGALQTVAEGDLTAELALLSDRDTMGLSLQQMMGNLNNMFGEINSSTAQVSTGSKQIADGAQSLAQGSTEQAAAVEQLSSSISEIAVKTKQNAEMAGKAAHLANTIKGNAEKGSRQMNEMMGAVKDINEASQNISKVIKTIDDIAFQTNILALNAAVEAARAGQHGKGFAVVAEEVRSLAAKSAEAAKDTGELIANSMEKAELGARIADETATSLAEIVSGINESSKLVNDIARSSEEESEGITQINRGIDQVAQVIQQNSATAEQSAAASEEMSGQADMLESLIAQFKLKDSANYRAISGGAPKAPKPQKRLEMPQKSTYAPPSGGDFGKY